MTLNITFSGYNSRFLQNDRYALGEFGINSEEEARMTRRPLPR